MKTKPTDLCQVCQKNPITHSIASTFTGIGYGACTQCAHDGLMPYDELVLGISVAGHFPDDISAQFQEEVRYILDKLGVSEAQFISDVNAKIREEDAFMEQYMKDHPAQPGSMIDLDF